VRLSVLVWLVAIVLAVAAAFILGTGALREWSASHPARSAKQPAAVPDPKAHPRPRPPLDTAPPSKHKDRWVSVARCSA